MENKHYLFKFGGALFITSGATGLFFWIISLLGGFETTPLPVVGSFTGASGIMIFQYILMLLGTLCTSLGLILAGLVFIEIPKVVSGGDITQLEENVNRTQKAVWKIIKHMQGTA